MNLKSRLYLTGMVPFLVVSMTGVPAAAPPTKPLPVKTPAVRSVSPVQARPPMPGPFSASVKATAPPPGKVGTASPIPPPVKTPVVSSLVYNYNPKGKPDPFKPFVQLDVALRKKAVVQKKQFIPRTPLQVYPVEQYKLVGIAGDEQSRVAMVKDSTGKFFPLAVGTYLGNRNGRVIQITANSVVIDESAAAGRKGAKMQKKVLQLASSWITEQKEVER